ncbi:MAG: efflux RND transporter periplasmic adaptor subunit [Candidatus Gottesmanbacteria bacterium]
MKRLFKNKIVWIVAVIIFISALVGNSMMQSKKGTSAKTTTYTVTRQTVKETLSVAGTIEAEEKATLRFQSSGLLSWVGVKEGDTVKKYQAIAGLDQQELKKTLEKYLYTYDKTRWDFEQTKDEYQAPAQNYWGLSINQRSDIDRAFQKAQFDLNSSVLDVELKSISLRYATLTTPIDGIITKVGTSIAGVNVTPTQAEFDIVNPSTLYLSVLPDQTEVGKLSSGMSADIIFDSYPNITISGLIKSIAFTPKTGESSTVYEVKLSFPLDTHYRIGMTADASFIVNEKKDVLAVPPSFLKTDNAKPYIFRKVGNSKEKTPVVVGIEGDNAVEITGGLAEGDILYD